MSDEPSTSENMDVEIAEETLQERHKASQDVVSLLTLAVHELIERLRAQREGLRKGASEKELPLSSFPGSGATTTSRLPLQPTPAPATPAPAPVPPAPPR
ncbi:hypothetical protein Y032_0563g3525 [Ancylostoma ceylanicum]|uniref:Uncharacterized protein n=1 Tax=Ancylostoma ceylanicum TaxID=53326 RepID=A0A016WQS1_9BILA|nr:hypothetical protein Y032_0563g3525 [Ancylostoma ceylanicum]